MAETVAQYCLPGPHHQAQLQWRLLEGARRKAEETTVLIDFFPYSLMQTFSGTELSLNLLRSDITSLLPSSSLYKNSMTCCSLWSPHWFAPFFLNTIQPLYTLYSPSTLITSPTHSRLFHSVSPCWKIDSSCQGRQQDIPHFAKEQGTFMSIWMYKYIASPILLGLKKTRQTNAFHNLDLRIVFKQSSFGLQKIRVTES